MNTGKTHAIVVKTTTLKTRCLAMLVAVVVLGGVGVDGGWGEGKQCKSDENCSTGEYCKKAKDEDPAGTCETGSRCDNEKQCSANECPTDKPNPSCISGICGCEPACKQDVDCSAKIQLQCGLKAVCDDGRCETEPDEKANCERPTPPDSGNGNGPGKGPPSCPNCSVIAPNDSVDADNGGNEGEGDSAGVVLKDDNSGPTSDSQVKPNNPSDSSGDNSVGEGLQDQKNNTSSPEGGENYHWIDQGDAKPASGNNIHGHYNFQRHTNPNGHGGGNGGGNQGKPPCIKCIR